MKKTLLTVAGDHREMTKFMRLALKCAFVGYGGYWIFVEQSAMVIWSVQALLIFNISWMLFNGIPDWTIVFAMCESAVIAFLFGCTVDSLTRVDSFLFFLGMEQVLRRDSYVGCLLVGFPHSRRNISHPAIHSDGAKGKKMQSDDMTCSCADLKDCSVGKTSSIMSHCHIEHGIEEESCQERQEQARLKGSVANRFDARMTRQQPKDNHSDSSSQSGDEDSSSDSAFHWGEIVACVLGMLLASYVGILDWNEPWQTFPNPQMTALLMVKFGCIGLKVICVLLNGTLVQYLQEQ